MQAIEAYTKGGFTELVIDGKREYVQHYNFTAPFWKGRARAEYPAVVKELKTNLQDLATYFPRGRAEIQARRGLSAGRALVPQLPDFLPGRARFRRHELSAGGCPV